MDLDNSTQVHTECGWATQLQSNGPLLQKLEAAQSATSQTLGAALAAVDRPFALLPADPPSALTLLFTDRTSETFENYAEKIVVPACRLEHLGDASFRADHGLRYAYLAGAMANGIGSVDIVEAMGKAGMLAFFGSAGLPICVVEKAIDQIQARLPHEPYGMNLIHSPNEPNLEASVVDLYLKKNVELIEASAFLDLTLPVVRYRVQGIRKDASGKVIASNRIIAKVSRVEVASKFLAPPPQALLRRLVTDGDITSEQAELAGFIPVAQDITAEADSAGHTDNRPMVTLLPTMTALRDRMQSKYQYRAPLRIGAAGGISTPASAVAALGMGAAYILTGSVNQSCIESGSSAIVRQMLAEAEQADIMMAPAADMFEMGVKLQVLKRGTMFALRAAKLYELYRKHSGLEDIPPAQRSKLERTIFRLPINEVWTQTYEFFQQRDPAQLDRARNDPKHKMALVFRWYLGQSSEWANTGQPDRKIDYQIWCGPAMGAFNEWVKGSCLEKPQNRRVAAVAMNILYGAAVLLRCQCLRMQGFTLPADWRLPPPLTLEELLQRSHVGLAGIAPVAIYR